MRELLVGGIIVLLLCAGGATSFGEMDEKRTTDTTDDYTIELLDPTGGETWSGTEPVTWIWYDTSPPQFGASVRVDRQARGSDVWKAITGFIPSEFETIETIGVNTLLIDDGDYKIRVCLYTYLGLVSSDSSDWLTIDNWEPPHKPHLSGPTVGVPDESYSYTAWTTDPYGKDVQYYFDWDNDYSLTDFYPPGTNVTLSNSWNDAGEYIVRVRAYNSRDWSEWSDNLTVTISNPPDKPDTPTGTSLGITGREYTYSTSTIDMDGGMVQYGWDWNGDKVVDMWTSLSPSGETVETRHAWNTTGDYDIRVKARDEHGIESIWSEKLVVTMPRPFSAPSLWLHIFQRIVSAMFTLPLGFQ